MKRVIVFGYAAMIMTSCASEVSELKQDATVASETLMASYTGSMQPGDQLRKGEYLENDDQSAFLTIDKTGHLVAVTGTIQKLCKLYWSSNEDQQKVSKGGATVLKMQEDGNLVLYTEDQSPTWSSQSTTRGAEVHLQEDLKIVLYSGGTSAENAVKAYPQDKEVDQEVTQNCQSEKVKQALPKALFDSKPTNKQPAQSPIPCQNRKKRLKSQMLMKRKNLMGTRHVHHTKSIPMVMAGAGKMHLVAKIRRKAARSCVKVPMLIRQATVTDGSTVKPATRVNDPVVYRHHHTDTSARRCRTLEPGAAHL